MASWQYTGQLFGLGPLKHAQKDTTCTASMSTLTQTQYSGTTKTPLGPHKVPTIIDVSLFQRLFSTVTGASLSEPHSSKYNGGFIRSTVWRTVVHIIYMYVTCAPRLAASVYTHIYIHVFDTTLCTLANAFVQRSSSCQRCSQRFCSWHDLAKMDASKQEAKISEGARGPMAQLKLLNKESEYLVSI